MGVLLIVEDNKYMQILYERVISGHNLLFASNTNEARKHLKSHPHIDLIILDIMLPDENGLDFLKYLKTTPEYKPIAVIVSSVIDDEYNIASQCMNDGAYKYVRKTDIETIPKHINEALRSQCH